jgi:hypothetical protein
VINSWHFRTKIWENLPVTVSFKKANSEAARPPMHQNRHLAGDFTPQAQLVAATPQV